MLMNALRNDGGHPKSEWGDGETWRFYYIDECRRRGETLLKQLKWSTREGALYVNIHTGSIKKLIDIATNDGYFIDRPDHTISQQVWSIIEHWDPHHPEAPNDYLIAYMEADLSRLRKIKAKRKLDAYEKSEVRRIPVYERIILDEKAKARSLTLILR